MANNEKFSRGAATLLLLAMITPFIVSAFSPFMERDEVIDDKTSFSSSNHENSSLGSVKYHTTILSDITFEEGNAVESARQEADGTIIVQFNEASAKYVIHVPDWSMATSMTVAVNSVEYLIESTQGSGNFDTQITDPSIQKYVGIKLKDVSGEGFVNEQYPNWDGSTDYIYGFHGSVTGTQDKKSLNRVELNCKSDYVTATGAQVPIQIRIKGLCFKLIMAD